MLFGVPPGNIFEKNGGVEIASKKGCPLIQTSGYDHGPRLPDRLPRVRISQTRNNSSSSKCCSSSCPWLWFPKIARQWLFELLASIANVSETNRKNERRVDVKSTSLVIWYALDKVHIPLAFVCSCNGCSCILLFVASELPHPLLIQPHCIWAPKVPAPPLILSPMQLTMASPAHRGAYGGK